jgi:hypothetical protein
MTKKRVLSKACFLLMLTLWVGALEGQERPSGGAGQVMSANAELTQLRNSWLLERKLAVVRLDLGYEESLVSMKERAKEKKDKAALALVGKEEVEWKLRFEEARAALPALVPNSGVLRSQVTEPSFQKGQATMLAGKLAGRVWRVDHEGEGLRWYYFAEDGSLARKSRLTNWVWTDLSGTWRVDPRGVIEIRSEGPTAQVLAGDHGHPVIAINRAGSLSQRPLKETDLDYPGKGKE